MTAAGTLAGEGRLQIGLVVVTSIAGWLLGSLAGYEIGLRGGRALLDHPGRLEKSRRKTLAKGDKAFARHNFAASETLPAYVSGIFRVRLHNFLLGALVSGTFFVAVLKGFLLSSARRLPGASETPDRRRCSACSWPSP